MLRPLERTSRRALVTGSLATVICSALMVPLAGSTSGYLAVPRRASESLKSTALTGDDPWKAPAVTIRRDPFLPEAALVTARPSPPESAPAVVGMKVVQGEPISAGATSGIAVLAIAFGARSKAVVRLGGTTKIVAPGDFINTSRVESILPDRIVLSDGRNLMLARRPP